MIRSRPMSVGGHCWCQMQTVIKRQGGITRLPVLVISSARITSVLVRSECLASHTVSG